MKHYDYTQHVRGESLFVDDITTPEGTLHAYVFSSPSAHGKIKSIDTSEALKQEDIVTIFSAKDIPGQNQIGGIIQDEVLFAEDYVDFIGQPIAVFIAKNQKAAKAASKLIKVDIEKLPVITDPREAFKRGELIIPPRVFSCGNLEKAWKECDVIVEGEAESGAQEHIYLETQGSIALPMEGGGIKVISSTQSPTIVQRTTARVLNLPMHKVEVDVLRLGGGFGGKEDQATAWAAMAALAAYKLNKPVKLILPRQEDMRMTGKRHPYSSDFKIGLTKAGKILAYEVTFYQNAGAAADLSPAVLGRTLFHTTNSYYIPNVKATGLSCKTNLPPNTAFRGFGGPQAMFVMEAAIYKAACKMGIDPVIIQKKNLLKENDEFPYGQKAERSQAVRCWETAEALYNIHEIKQKIKEFNRTNILYKKGIAMMPVCFGISFTNTFMNQASTLVHIYSDGSVSISTAAVEMGQGVNSKLRYIASKILSINIDRIKIETTNTTRVANSSPTAASASTDLNGKAVEIACNILLERLRNVAAEELQLNQDQKNQLKEEEIFVDNSPSGLKWEKLISFAIFKRTNLSAQAQYATPGIYFDKEKSKGNAFAYHSYGTAIIETTVDCLRGTYVIDSVKVVHDFGTSFDETIDRGQAEGAILQGIGWMTLEEIIYDENGKLITDALSTYKIPDIYSVPQHVEIHFLKDSKNPMGILNSKAIGEPPLMYGIGSFFAIMNAIKEFRSEEHFNFSAPFTNEKVLLSLYSKVKKLEV